MSVKRPAGRVTGRLWLAIGAALLGSPGRAADAPPISPPLEQDSADCLHPVYATDRLVCGDPQLRALDADMAVRTVRLEQRSGWPASPFFEDQTAWFERRSLCAFQAHHRTCAATAYRVRIVELDAMIQPITTGMALQCKGQPSWHISSLGSLGAHVVTKADGTPLFVAFPRARGPWAPFISYHKSATRLTLQRIGETKPLVCTLISPKGSESITRHSHHVNEPTAPVETAAEALHALAPLVG